MTTVPAWVAPRGEGGLVVAAACLVGGTGAIVAVASGHANAVQVDVVRLGAWLVGPVAAALVLDSRPGHPTGLVLAVSGLFPLAWLLTGLVTTGALPAIEGAPQPTVLWLVGAATVATGLLITFPGRPQRVPTLVLLRMAPALAAGSAAIGAVSLGRDGGGLTASPSTLDVTAFSLAGGAIAVAVLARAVAANETGGLEGRRQRWLVALVLTVLVLAALLGWMAAEGQATLAGYIGAAIHAVGFIGVASVILSEDLPEVGFAYTRLVLLILVSAALAMTYELALASLSWTDLPNQSAAAAAATALVGVGLLPVYGIARDRLAVLFYGTSRRPELVLAMLGHSLDTAGEAGDVLRSACEAVASAVRSPAASVVPPEDAHDVPDGAITVPLQAGGQFVGTLVVAPRRPGESYSRREVDLVNTLAGTLAQVARATSLAAALESARRDLAVERRDERRRLRRDLHDGLGPLLSSLGLRLDALGRTTSQGAPTQIRELKDTVATARREVRRLVEGLAPEGVTHAVALEDSLGELVRGWGSATAPHGLAFDLEIGDPLPELPEDTRIAVYRVAGEAITNVVRHARATSCAVSVYGTPEGGLVLEVLDNGIGMGRAANGFGLRSMQERAGALGGTVTTETQDAGGTLVRLWLPAAAEVPG